MQLFYNSELNESSKAISFSKEESRHIVKVLRKKIGDTLIITNGIGWRFEAEITSDTIKHCRAEIASKQFFENHAYHLHMVVAPTKMNDRYEWFLEKATEIGVNEITPIICDNSERKVIKKERLEKIVHSAMKQSLQFHLPKLNDAMPLKSFLSQPIEGQKFIAHCEETERKSLKNNLKPNGKAVILIGPEGDFSVKEIEIALQHNFIPVTLGSTRLRTETAAIVACHTVALCNAK